ncbi:MAG: sulfotransferase [Hyphomicrobiales bacterium]
MIHRAEKVFGIGLSRTGTRSLTEALSLLGYRAGHYSASLSALKLSNGKLVADFDEIDRWDALTDTPMAAVYKDLNLHYPNAKFVLTVREGTAWLASVEDHYVRASRDKGLSYDVSTRYAVRHEIYGRTDFNKPDFISAYERHVASVCEYFSRSNDLLVFEICADAGWEPLCRFLNLPIPDTPFPHANAAPQR